MQDAVVRVTTFIIRLLQVNKILGFRPIAVIHSAVPAQVMNLLPEGQQFEYVARLTHAAFWAYRTNKELGSTTTLATTVCTHVQAAFPHQAVFDRWEEVVDLQQSIYQFVKARRRNPQLLRYLQPYDYIAARFGVAITPAAPLAPEEQIPSLFERLRDFEEDAKTLCPRPHELERVTVEELWERVCDLEDELAAAREHKMNFAADWRHLPTSRTGQVCLCHRSSNGRGKLALC
ncbi:hypothetical protein OC842_005328 [Tilletia horrida]|uniref:Uncharacterized protein n=1 Tax=Tilletia horrida TaxID=155126 RepID=A0AAN6G830_9BASI|nr:hypothetical protein OC842_005328 [Tilletia horrida]